MCFVMFQKECLELFFFSETLSMTIYTEHVRKLVNATTHEQRGTGTHFATRWNPSILAYGHVRGCILNATSQVNELVIGWPKTTSSFHTWPCLSLDLTV